MSRAQSIALCVTVAIVAIAAGMLLSRMLLDRGTESQRTARHVELAAGTLLDPPRPLPAVDFVDQDGKAFGAQRLQGRWSLLFFGFTSCPDICPATLSLLAQAEKKLADLPAPQRPHIVLVSVDPQRDTPERLRAYVKSFSPSFLGIRAPQDVVDEFARQMGVLVMITKPQEGSYTVDHSASIFLVNPDGALRALFSTPHSAQRIADDYRRIVAIPAT